MDAFDQFLRRNMRIYGALRQCTGGDWGKALTELLITLLFALFAVWVPLIIYPMFGLADNGWTGILYRQIENGELYILTTALLAPVFYFTFPNARTGLTTESRHFPSQQVIILIFVGTVIVSALAVAATKVQAVDATGSIPSKSDTVTVGAMPISTSTPGTAAAPSSVGANAAASTPTSAPEVRDRPHIPSRMITWSMWLFAFTTVLYFLTLVVRNWLERGGVDEVFDEQSREQDRRTPPPEPDEVAPTAPLDPEQMVRDTIAEHTVPADAD